MMSCRKGSEALSDLDAAKARLPRSPELSSPQCAKDSGSRSSSDMDIGPGGDAAADAGGCRALKSDAGSVLEDLERGGIASSSSNPSENKVTFHVRDPSVPNTVTSESHPCSKAAAAGAATASPPSSCSTTSSNIDADTDGKGKGKAKSGSQGPFEWSTLSSASPSPSLTSTKLSFLDKVEAGPDAPRTVAISPYGSSHPLFLAAKKYRLQVNKDKHQLATSIATSIKPPSSSLSPSDPVPKSTTPDISVSSRASKDIDQEEKAQVKQQDYFSAPKEEETEPEEVTFRVPSLSRISSPSPPITTTTTTSSTSESQTESTMGSRPAYARSQMRIARRPSPLDLPAAKRRRSIEGSIHVVKVEDREDETTFLISSSKEESRDAAISSELPPSRTSVSIAKSLSSITALQSLTSMLLATVS